YALAVLLMGVLGNCVWAAEGKLGFVEEGKGFAFDTGVVKGLLHKEGRSLGITNVVDVGTGKEIAGAAGILSHYRLLDDRARYGPAGWEWKSEAKLLADGAVEVKWAADEVHPFDMKAVYRWVKPNVLDAVTEVTAKKELKGFEVFLASYFAGFEQSFVAGKEGFVEAVKGGGDWQAWVRDEAGAKLVGDGRWKREPNPVDWLVKGEFREAMGMRKDAKSGLVALVMSPREDCFAVLTPFGEEGHRSMYLSLFGVDFKVGETKKARARVVIGKGIEEVEARMAYRRWGEEGR
ncbi:MAG: hypothetical protein NTU53_01920, partial [Planctomycetota bacterium]|nr:hypothetical protein [Planctomycetota bacterium]